MDNAMDNGTVAMMTAEKTGAAKPAVRAARLGLAKAADLKNSSALPRFLFIDSSPTLHP
jgi:hypothetical protein